MNDELIADLKQFIAGLFAQEFSGVRGEIVSLREDVQQLGRRMNNLELKVDHLDQNLNRKIDDLSSFVAEAILTNNEEVDLQLKDHKKPIKLLEQRIPA